MCGCVLFVCGGCVCVCRALSVCVYSLSSPHWVFRLSCVLTPGFVFLLVSALNAIHWSGVGNSFNGRPGEPRFCACCSLSPTTGLYARVPVHQDLRQVVVLT